MKSFFSILWIFLLLFVETASAQSYPPVAKVYGTSPFQDSLWSFNTLNNSFTTVDRMAPTLPGFTVTGTTGMAYDPCGNQVYVILKVSGVSGRVLATIDLSTAVCTQIGNLGDNFSSLTFDRTGQLYGVTGDGASVSETLYSIDKTNGTKTLLTALGNGADGEVICYNPDDDMIYHWSGNGTVVYEKIQITAPYTVTNIPIIGTTGGETFGVLYYAPDTFLISSISSNFRFATTTGTYSAVVGAGTPDDIRGTVILPVFATEDDTLCVGDLVNVGADGIRFFDVIYDWGDGNIDTVAGGSGSHVYSSPGNHTVNVSLSNGFCTSGNVYTKVIVVNALPSVALSGNTALCPAASTTLTGTAGGSSQWYLNGVAIGGATSNTYTTSTPGTYNMTKINTNGCMDSAAIGITVISVPNPTVALGNDTTVCGGLILDAQNAGGSYLWGTGETTQTLMAGSSGVYTVMVTDINSCVGNDTIDLVVNANPTVALGNDTAVCGNIILDAQNAGSSYAWATGETTQTLVVSSSGTYTVSVTDGNGCSASDDIILTVNAAPTVALGNDTTVCGGLMLDAQNAGGSYLWGTGETTQTLVVSSSGTYTVSVTDGNGCSASDDIILTVNANPTVALGNDTAVCGSIVLDAQNAGSSYAWATGETTQTLSVSSSGTYTVSVTDGNGCSASDDIVLTVNANPTVTYQETDTILCSNIGTAITLAAGSPAGGVYSGINVSGNSFDPIGLADGTYDVTYTFTDGNGCVGMDVSQIHVSICSGIGQLQQNGLSIFPNPTKGIFIIDMKGINGNVYQLTVVNALGEVVYSAQINKQQTVIDFSTLANGMYIVLLNSENERFVSKLIKE